MTAKLDHTTVYAGIPEALGTIQNSANGTPRKLAVLSNKPVIPSRAIVNALGLGRFFSQVYGGNSFTTKKPDPEGARKLLEEYGVQPQQAAIVGDSHVDISTGRNAGMVTIGVTYGFAPHTFAGRSSRRSGRSSQRVVDAVHCTVTRAVGVQVAEGGGVTGFKCCGIYSTYNADNTATYISSLKRFNFPTPGLDSCRARWVGRSLRARLPPWKSPQRAYLDRSV